MSVDKDVHWRSASVAGGIHHPEQAFVQLAIRSGYPAEKPGGIPLGHSGIPPACSTINSRSRHGALRQI